MKRLKDIAHIQKLQKYLFHPVRIAFVAILLWSTQAILLGKSFNQTDFSAILFPAFTISTLYLLLFKIFYTGKKYQEFREIFGIGNLLPLVIGIGLMFGYHVFLYWGLQSGPEIETNLLNFLWPLVFFILGYLLFSKRFLERNNRKYKINKIATCLGNSEFMLNKALGNVQGKSAFKIMMGLAGASIIISGDQFGQFNLTNWCGPIMGILAALFWALFSLFLIFTGKSSHLTTYIGGTAILTTIVWWLRGMPEIWPTFWISAYMGIFPLGIAMQCWEKAMKEDYIDKISVLAFVAPLLSTIFLLMGGIGNMNQQLLIGGGLILWANMNFRKKNE